MRALGKAKSQADKTSSIKPISMAETLAEADRNLKNMPRNYQMAVRAARELAEAGGSELMETGSFKPVLE
jgi:hypothetical protein